MMNYPSSRILLLAAGLLGTGAANGAVLVYSGFEGYPDSGAVAGTGAPTIGDIGIAADTWAGGNWSWQGTGLSYTDANGTINGGSRALDYTGSNYQFRQVNVSPSSAIQETVFIRFLVDIDDDTRLTGNRVSGAQFVINNDVSNNNNDFSPGFGIFAGGPTVTNGTNTNQFFAASTSGAFANNVAPTQLFGGTINSGTNMLVGQLVWDGSEFSTLNVWANPLHADEASPDATLDISGLDINSLSEVVIRGGANHGGPRPIVDELVIATAWNDVVIAAIPEPSTYALLGGLAALGLVILRRRRA